MYIRFGEIPEDERSTIFFHGEPVGKEIGASVYHACKIKDKYHIAYPNPCTETTVDTLHGALLMHLANLTDERIYLVDGEEVGIGSDGEPLIKNVRIIKDITDNFTFLKSNK